MPSAKAGFRGAPARGPQAAWRCAAALLLAIAVTPCAQAITTGPVAGGFSAPIDVVNAHDGSDRLLVAEQGGRIRIVQGGARLAASFLDLTALVVSGGERGLLGVAFHPAYRDNGTWHASEIVAFGSPISTFGEDEQGELYFADYGQGEIRRFVPQSGDRGEAIEYYNAALDHYFVVCRFYIPPALVDSNHRYTTDPAIRDRMVAQGGVAEGYGADAVAMCAPQ